MYKLVETKLQKIVLLVGGLFIFFRLIGVGYYERYNAILSSIGIFILTVIVLIILRDFHPTFHKKILAFLKNRKKFIYTIFVILFVIFSIWAYRTIQNRQALSLANEKFHQSEVAYQKCLDKIHSITTWGAENYGDNKYFDAWVRAGRPNYDMRRGHWEWGAVGWLVKNNPDFCSEFDVNLIKNYLIKRGEEMGINYL